VLGDSAETPRFVETLPRRGYRFIGEIEHPSVAASGDSNGKMDPGQVALETASQLPVQTDPSPQPKTLHEGSPKRFRGWVLAVAVLALVLVSLGCTCFGRCPRRVSQNMCNSPTTACPKCLRPRTGRGCI
jgi:hypothetical protein